MPEQVRVGSVAEETARLLDALLKPAPPAPASDREPVPESAPPDSAAAADDLCPTCGHAPGEATSVDGATRAADVCHLCPVCHVLRVVRSVSPETLDRLADLAAAVTESLRDAAASRWRDTSTPGTSDAQRSGPAVEEIVVTDATDAGDESRPAEREDTR